MLIRRWQFEDDEQIAMLEKICFHDSWTKDMVDQTVISDNFVGFVLCEEDGKICGYAGSISAGYDADIALVAVAPEYRRRGYAKQLLDTLIAELRVSCVEQVFLEVRVNNHSAIALYEKCGFIPVGIRRAYYEDGTDAIVMLKDINVGK